MSTRRQLQEFIKRAQNLLANEVEESYKNNYEMQKKYNYSEKGREAKRRGDEIRRERKRQASQDRDWAEKINVRRFYENCPEGYVVDHIIPLCKGGRHIISNLQYLTRRENARKWCK